MVLPGERLHVEKREEERRGKAVTAHGGGLGKSVMMSWAKIRLRRQAQLWRELEGHTGKGFNGKQVTASKRKMLTQKREIKIVIQYCWLLL